MWPHVIPFASYMVFIALGGLISSDQGALWLYPPKIFLVSALLVFYWKNYPELKENPFSNMMEIGLSIGVGLFVYFAWVRLDFPWAKQGESGKGYDPYEAGVQVGMVLAAIRIVGASVVVPVMEEVFWRSFIIRYIVSPDFTKVKLGTFSLLSFLITVVFFGVEHHFWFAGMMAGAIYNLLLYKTRRLWPCILAHGITNLAMGIHVLTTEEWFWW
jgi:uncharacterized protein